MVTPQDDASAPDDDPIVAARKRLDDAIAKLSAQLAGVPVLQAEIDRLSDENTALQSRIATLEAECEQLRGGTSEAETRLALAEVDRAQTISDLEKERDEWRQKYEQQTPANSNGGLSQDTEDALRESLDHAIDQIESLLEEAG